jgi:hypothetical protein
MSWIEDFIARNTPVDYYDEEEYEIEQEIRANCYGDYDEDEED